LVAPHYAAIDRSPRHKSNDAIARQIGDLPYRDSFGVRDDKRGRRAVGRQLVSSLAIGPRHERQRPAFGRVGAFLQWPRIEFPIDDKYLPPIRGDSHLCVNRRFAARQHGETFDAGNSGK
jgi:hypothetical protein